MTSLYRLSWLAVGALVACGGSNAEPNEPTHSAPDAPKVAEGGPAEGDEDAGKTKQSTYYQIDYPSNWSLMQPPPHGVDSLARSPQEADGDFQENLNVVVETLPQSMTTPEFAMASTAGMQQMIKGFELISTNEIRLGDKSQAIEVVYKSNFQQELHHIAVMLADKSERGYVITGTATPDAFAKFAPVFRKAAKTFKVKN